MPNIAQLGTVPERSASFGTRQFEYNALRSCRGGSQAVQRAHDSERLFHHMRIDLGYLNRGMSE